MDEAAIGVIDEPLEFRIRVACDHACGNLIIQAEVQDGVHHAGHGSARAATDRYKQRILGVTELLAVDLFHLSKVFIDFRLNFRRNLFTVVIITGAGLGRNREALRNGHAEPRHLRKVCAFAAEELAHVLVALREQVNILVAHSKSSSNLNISEIITTTAGFPKKP